MGRQRNRVLLKIIIVVPYMLVLYIFQSMVFPYLKISGVAPLLLPLAVAGAALFNGRAAGGVIGIFAGILCDLSFNQSTIVFTIFLAVAGVLLGAICDSVLVKGFPSYLLCCTCLLILCGFVQMFPLVFLHGVSILPLIGVVFRQTIYSVFFTIPIYYMARFVSRII